MIVIAIIGILSAIAIPSYQRYLLQADLANFLTLSQRTNTLIQEYHQTYELLGEAEQNNGMGMIEIRNIGNVNIDRLCNTLHNDPAFNVPLPGPSNGNQVSFSDDDRGGMVLVAQKKLRQYLISFSQGGCGTGQDGIWAVGNSKSNPNIMF